MKNEERISRIATGILLSALAIIVALCFVAINNYNEIYSLPLVDDNEYVMETGWEVAAPDGSIKKNVKMPEVFHYEGSGTYTLKTTLPDLRNEYPHPVVLVAANHMDIAASVDGEEIYSLMTAGKGLSKTPGNNYHVITLPDDYAGRTLEIRMTLLLGDSIPYTVLAPVMASRAAIITHMFKSDFHSIMLINLILVFGLLLFAMAIVFRKLAGQWQLLVFTGFFALLFSGYALCETEMLHLLITNSYVIYLCDFLFLALLPAPILLLLTMFVRGTLKKLLYAVISINIVSFLAQILLNFAHVRDLREMLPLTHFVILISMVMVVLSLYVKTERQDAVRNNFKWAILPVLIGAVLDLILFYIPESFSENSFFFQLGVLVFVIMQMWFALHTYVDLYTQTVRMNFYEKMAYTDGLTQIGNRAAFERELKRLMDVKEELLPLWCVSADINNLKWVNDNHGHSAGDKIICETAHILRSLSEQVCRTGGDEFVFFQENTGEAEIKQKIDEIYCLIEAYNQENVIPLSLAVRYDFLRPEDKNILDLYIRVDQYMYQQKEKMKEKKRQP